MRLSIGAILMVTVPETIMRSEWRGDAHGTMPKRSTSKREAKVAIISIAQHARPNVTGQMDDWRAQLKILSVDVVTTHPPGMWWIASAMEARVFDTTSTDKIDRKSTRLNSSHSQISYAVFCLEKTKQVY